MYNVKVFVTYKASILDPQGQAIQTALHRLNYENVKKVTQGKYFELTIQPGKQPIEQQVESMCQELLTNTNMESFRYEIEPVVEVNS